MSQWIKVGLIFCNISLVIFEHSRKLKDGTTTDTATNTIANGVNNYVATINNLNKSFNQDVNSQNDKNHRTIVPNHVIPSDVPQEKHPNAAFANNFIR